MTNTTMNPIQAEISAKVISIIAACQQIEAAEIDPGSTLESLGIDSMDILNIGFSLADEFDIDESELANQQILNVAELIDIVRKLSPGN